MAVNIMLHFSASQIKSVRNVQAYERIIHGFFLYYNWLLHTASIQDQKRTNTKTLTRLDTLCLFSFAETTIVDSWSSFFVDQRRKKHFVIKAKVYIHKCSRNKVTLDTCLNISCLTNKKHRIKDIFVTN